MHKCLNCGNEFESKFCPKCGKKWVDPDVCPKCGAHHEPDAIFCGECGARLDGKIVCPQCGALLDNGTAFCGACGTKVNGKAEAKGNAVKEQNKKEKGKVLNTIMSIIGIVGIGSVILSALIGLVFIFVTGVSLVEDGKVIETDMLYTYFGDSYKSIDKLRETLKSIGGAREFALYFPVVLGTLISVLGILGVLAMSAVTVVMACLKFIKKKNVNVIVPAAATYLTFATTATLLLLLSATRADGTIAIFSAPTLAGLIIGGICLGHGLVLSCVSHFREFKKFNTISGTAVAVVVSVLTIIVISLSAMPAIKMGISYFDGYSSSASNASFSLFVGMQSMLLLIESNEAMQKIVIFVSIGGVAAILLVALSAATLLRKLSAIGNGNPKRNITLATVTVVLAAVYLAFAVLTANEMSSALAELFWGPSAVSGVVRFTMTYGLPIAILVITFIALVVEVAGAFVRKKEKPVEAAEEINTVADAAN